MNRSESHNHQGEVISESLLALLVCPIDKGRLDLDSSSLVCTVCGRAYPVEDGIPNMLVEDNE